MRRLTLTWKLFLRITPTILVAIAVIGVLAFRSARREIDNIYDAKLINDANVLWTLLEHQIEEPGNHPPRQVKDMDFAMGNQLAMNDQADDYADAHVFRLWKDGRIRIFTNGAFPESVPVQRAGFTELNYANERWLVYSLPIPNTGIVVEVGEKRALRDTLVSNIMLNLFFPLLVLVPVIGLLVWYGISNGLGPIHGLVRQIRSRSPDDLSVIAIDALPRDLHPLGMSVNQLLSKLDRSLTAERRFADQAAHQLRTPHAGIKLLLQMLAHADSETERETILADLTASNDKATRLVKQMLEAARISHQPVELRVVRLYDVTASVIAEFGTIITLKRHDVSLDGDEAAEVKTDEPMLRLLIGNLIDNAIKYTPAGGKIKVSISPEPGAWTLSITDSGPGIAPQHREAVFRRFYRVNVPEVEGSGLGLAIVSGIVERLSANIALSTPSPGGGLHVAVTLRQA
ncbi:ATP-binding protein [Mesorhizobium sp. M0051]|uniref:sensor histidine kinase n=1 Tax=unclassified Mesorhizobium TaxID=325217 RepID=UPI0003CF9990|nr:ATP-binding protein [Mesorhizobium sp. LNHC252B00]ESY65370.1 histidine kinase [Mesorhizobium sp. LNHC252B00]